MIVLLYLLTVALPWMFIGALGALAATDVIGVYRDTKPAKSIQPDVTPRASEPPRMPLVVVIHRARRDARSDIQPALDRSDRDGGLN